MICLDRMLAIFFPLKMINYGYKSAITSSLIMCFLCLLFTTSYFVHLRSVKIGSKLFCTNYGGNNFSLKEFIRIWRQLFVYGGSVPVGLILLINILLLWKVTIYKNKLKTLVERVCLTSRKELKATILVLILTVFFLTGSIIKISLEFAIIFVQIMKSNDPILKNQLQNLYNIGDISTIFTFLMESVNILMYYRKIKRFRLECNKILGINK